MRAYKIELLVLDFEDMGEQQIVDVIQNARYPNRCISPQVKAVQVRDIGAWSDDHPLNNNATADTEYRRIFERGP